MRKRSPRYKKYKKMLEEFDSWQEEIIRINKLFGMLEFLKAVK